MADRRKPPYRLGFVATLALSLTACGGGGSGAAPVGSGTTGITAPATPIGVATAASQATQSVKVTIVIPKKSTTSSAARSTAYIAPNTQSIQFQLLAVNGQVQTSAPYPSPPFILGLSNPNCQLVNDGPAISCQLTLNAPVGNDIYAAVSFSDTAGTQPLGSGSVAINVLNNAPNTANLVLTGPVANVQLFTTTESLTNGNAVPQLVDSDSIARRGGQSVRRTLGGTAVTSSRIFIVATDTNGSQIVNPTTFDIPITLTLALNGMPPGVVSLGGTYAGLSAMDTGTFGTQTDGGTVTIYSPSDQVSLSIVGTVPCTTSSCSFNSAQYTSPYVTASYTPQGGSPSSAGPLYYSVSAYPLWPNFVESFAFGNAVATAGVADSLIVTVQNTGMVATNAPVSVSLILNGAALAANPYGTSTFWACTPSSSPGPSVYIVCTSNAGQTIAAGGSAPPITVSFFPLSPVNSGGATVYTEDYGLQYTQGTLYLGPAAHANITPAFTFSATSFSTAITPPALFSSGQSATLDFGKPPGSTSGQTVSIAAQSGFIGHYTLVGTDPCTMNGVIDTAFDNSLATISAAGSTPVSFPLNVTATSNAMCTITIQDTMNDQASLTIQVEQASLTVNGTTRARP